jgi:acetyl esterase/lipase
MKQLEELLKLSAQAPPPEDGGPSALRDWFEAINAQTPVAPEISIEPVNQGAWSGEYICLPNANMQRLIIYYHGGGFFFGSSRSHRTVTSHLAKISGARVLSVDYRLAPEHPAPAAHEDAYDAYRWALTQGISSEAITLAGDSAGGNLALSTALRARKDGLPLPACLALLSPALDLAGEGASHRPAEPPPLLTREIVDLFMHAYVGEGDLKSEKVTPFYSDLSGLPPVLIHVGSWELLRDDSITIAERLKQADTPVALKVWPGMVHCWQLFAPMLDEGMQSIEEVSRFVTTHMDKHAGPVPRLKGL